ncbi:hypothetical protein Tco_0434704 [Tanacetum coccineum]
MSEDSLKEDFTRSGESLSGKKGKGPFQLRILNFSLFLYFGLDGRIFTSQLESCFIEILLQIIGVRIIYVDNLVSGDSTIDVVEDIPIDVPNILPTHPAIQLDFDFISSNDLGSDLDVSSPFGDSNKIYDPGICKMFEST